MKNFIIISRQRKSLRHSLVIALFIPILISCTGSEAMAGIFGSKTLFSAVSGKIVNNGEAVAGVAVEQRAQDSNGKPVVHTTNTAADGSFHFEEITTKKGFLDYLPSAVVVQQEINIAYDGNTLTGWKYTKSNRLSGSESAGKQFLLICDVSNEADFTDNYYGICRLVDD